MKKYFIILIFFHCSAVVYAQLQINELMQSNVDCIMDDLNEFPDSWVEIYNGGATIENLGDYRISLSNECIKAWQLSDSIIEPNSYIIVYCDNVGKGLHTDFRLKSGKGGSIFLFKNNQIVDSIKEIKKQPVANVSLGRLSESENKFKYQAVATPGSANSREMFKGVLGSPIFSEYGRIFEADETIRLSLHLPENTPTECVIKYTLDGSEPNDLSFTYHEPIVITNTTIIRAKLVCNGYASQRSLTQSFIFHNRKQTLPIISLVSDNDYFYDNRIGIYTEGNYNSEKANYLYNWRRPVNFEYYTRPNEKCVLNQLCETRIMGGVYSRNKVLKSLILYSNKRFGIKDFEYEFFPEDKPGIDKFNSIILRNSGNDFYDLYMLDAIIQRNMGRHCDLDWQAYQPAVLYINGKYSGIINIRERSNEDNIYSNYNGLKDIDMIENWNSLIEGSFDSFYTFRDFYNETRHSFEEYDTYLDWREFLNLMIMNLYYNNQDFPANNIVMWKPRKEEGKWRFVAKDCDFGLGHNNTPANYNTLEWMLNPNYDQKYTWANPYYSTTLFRNLLSLDNIKEDFISRCIVYIGDFLNREGTHKIWEPMYNQVKDEYPYHIELYDSINPMPYKMRFEEKDEWCEQRSYFFCNFLREKFNLGNVIPLTINKDITTSSHNFLLSINNILLNNFVFDGYSFVDHQMTIKDETGKIKGWLIRETNNYGEERIKEVLGPSCSFIIPKCKSLSINAVSEEDEIETHIGEVHKNSSCLIYDLTGNVKWSGYFNNYQEALLHLRKNNIYIIKNGNDYKKIINNY